LAPEEDMLIRDRTARRRSSADGLAWLAGGLLALVACVLAAPPAPAQPFDRPVQERMEVPGYEEKSQPELRPPQRALLPPLPVAGADEPELRVWLKGHVVVGGTVFSDEEIAALLQPWLGREIGSADLVAISNTVTDLYVDAGYQNSGAAIPDQDLSDGLLEIVIVEGELSRIDISGAQHYRASVLRKRIAAAVHEPLRLQDLELALQLLQQDPRIERISARLAPGERAGEAVLAVRVEEVQPYHVSLQASNYTPVAFGSYRGSFRLVHDNLLGFGDTLEARFRVSGGLFRFGGEYNLPLNGYGTTAFARGEYSSSKIIESGFEDLNIETDYRSVRLGVTHPVYRSERSTVELGLMGEWRQTDTTLLGSAYSFPGSGAVDGRTTVSPLRFVGSWTLRDRNQVIAARSMLSLGLPILGAKKQVLEGPSGQFLAWLGQFQWARRFDFLDLQSIFRTDVQLTNSPLPTLEQFTVGGHLTVRGYRENQQVRDYGVISSLELRVPLYQRERPILEIAPFADFGWSDNRNRPTPDPRILASVGLGLRWSITEQIRAQVYWGYQLEEVFTSGDLQDEGVQFSLTWDAF
jgi:hemolysin activation/secretion protein